MFQGNPRPFTTVDFVKDVEVPWIGLQCRTDLPTRAAELQYTAAAAVHEVAHAFNFRQRPLFGLYTEPWVWFDEGTSLLAEMLFLPQNPDGLRFLGDWVDRPEVPQDDLSALYQTGMFLRYLANVLGPAFLTRVWTEAKETETALEALVRLCADQERVFASDAPAVLDLFGAGYCVDSYFLRDPASGLYAPEVFERFGQRAVAHSFVLAPGSSGEAHDTLDHLACRYYRFALKDGAKRLVVRLQAVAKAPLKAVLAVVAEGGRRGESVVLEPVADPPPGGMVLVGELRGLAPAGLDHVVLVVSNCGLRGDNGRPGIPHDDRQHYSLWTES
jgi:hypothetical protein